MKNYILIAVFILAMVFFAFAIFYYTKNPSPEKNNNHPSISGNIVNNQNPGQKNNPSSSASPGSTGAKTDSSTISSDSNVSNGSSDKGSDDEENPLVNNITNPLPDDAYTVPCGMYYRGYQFCNGTCEEGTCVSENRSCYCKKLGF